MKAKLIILITITFFIVLVGCATHRALKTQIEAQQTQQQKVIDSNPDLAKFYK